MPTYFLRVEAVNLGNIIDDTDDLSTRRGGGLLALNAAVDLIAAMDLDVEPIATGASIGLFKLGANTTDPEGVVKSIHEHFRKHPLLKHGTFVVDVVEVKQPEIRGNEYKAEQLATARNRWQQLQEPALSVEGLWDAAIGPCPLDMIRPGTTEARLPENVTILASTSVAERRSYGRDARQKFYVREIGASAKNLHFTNSVLEIAGISQTRDGRTIPDDDPMKDKLAVFYVDGNKFGAKGRCIFQNDGSTGFSTWSTSLQKHHQGLLKGLIELTSKDDAWRFYDNNDGVERIRLETLLWGGDEIIFVVPGWKGWELAEWFFKQTHTVDGNPVTYSCGLVFCNVKAPIKNIITLAKRLGDLAKETVKDATKDHRLAYEVLESFDDIPGDLNEHRQRWLPKNETVSSLVIDPSQLKEKEKDCWDSLRFLARSKEFPMRQLYRLCKDWRNGDCFQKSVTRITADELKKHVETVLKAFSNKPVGYLHLLQMLPYIPSAKTGGAS